MSEVADKPLISPDQYTGDRCPLCGSENIAGMGMEPEGAV